MIEYKRPISFSQSNMFWTCPRSWYMKYVSKIPGVEDLTYAHRGSVLHHCLEEYYPEKTKTVQEIKEFFEKEWKKYKLDESFLRNKKDETWLMVLNGINLDLDITSVELKIYYPDVVSYLDVVDTNNKRIFDWKSSTRSHHNEKEYIMQLKYYSWLYYRKFDELPEYVGVYYLKYNGTKSELGIKPTMDDVEAAEKWHYKTREWMNYYLNNPDKLPGFNHDYFFSPYKHLWNLDDKNKDDLLQYVITINGSYMYLKGDVDSFLSNHIDQKFSYELKNAYFIQKNRPNANTIIRFWHKKMKRLPIGFYNKLMKTLNDYAEFRKKTPVISVKDNRYFMDSQFEMPDRLLSGKELRPYQVEAVEQFVNRNKIGILELSTGAGKTLIATEIIRRLGMKTLFVVDKKELLEQAKKAFEDNLDVPVGVIGAGKSDIQDVTVATIQTLNKNIDKYKEYLSEVRFCIFDETHKVGAKSYYKLGTHLRNTEYRLGITGTAYRDDGNDMMITATVGEIVYSLTGQRLIEDGYLQKPDIKFIKYEMDDKEITRLETQALDGLINETPDYAKFYEQFVKNNIKRNIIVKNIVDYHDNESVLILVKLVEHGKMLENMIPGSKYVYGETAAKQRDTIISEFKSGKQKVLISTISIFAEGVDIPGLTVIINAAANKGDVKTIQLLGRVLRKNEGKDKALYYDFKDGYKFFSNAANSRRKAFVNEGYDVEFVDETEFDKD